MFKSIYSEEEHEFMKKYVPGHSYVEIQREFSNRFKRDITIKQVRSYIGNYKLNTGRDTRFRKGNIPPYQYCFKKGNVSHTQKPVGSEVVNSSGYIMVKVAEPNEWKLKHYLVWEEHNGTIPDGSVVIFLDGNKRNFDINNFECITKAERLYLNRHGMRFTDPELMKTAISIAKVECKIAERKKHK